MMISWTRRSAAAAAECAVLTRLPALHTVWDQTFSTALIIESLPRLERRITAKTDRIIMFCWYLTVMVSILTLLVSTALTPDTDCCSPWSLQY